MTVEAIVIGASAGAFESLSEILPYLPADYSLPIMVVVHLPPDRKSVMAELMQAKCAVRIKEVEDKEDIIGGTVYFAAPDYHLLIESNKRLSLSTEEPVMYSRPSIDVLFDSASDAYGSSTLGIVLSGGNSDGALGLQTIMRCGGKGLVQKPDLAYAPYMPQAALDSCPYAQSLSLEGIKDYLISLSQPL